MDHAYALFELAWANGPLTRLRLRDTVRAVMRGLELNPVVGAMCCIVGWSGLFGRPALAQEDASGPGTTQVIEKIERGVFAHLEAGPAFLVAPDALSDLASETSDFGLALGMSIHFGFDVLPILNLSIGASALAASATEVVGGRTAIRDRVYFTPSLRAQLAVFTTERHFVWTRVEGGVSLLQTADAVANGGLSVGPSFGGAIGYEYFTALRHFSIGAQLGATVYLEPDFAVGIFVLPTLKYTF